MPAARRFALVMSGALLGLGGLFLSWPRAGAALFGLDAEPDPRLDYVRALGIRDLALATGLASAALAGRRPLALLAATSVLIPVLDFSLVARRRGTAAAPQLALHGASAAALLAITAASLLERRRA
jgi:hypothetical protein